MAEIMFPSPTERLSRARTVAVMERLHASEIFETPRRSKAFLDSLDYDEFKKYLSFVNGIERGIPVNERGKASSSSVYSNSLSMGTELVYRPPLQKFRDQLLKMAFDKAQSLDEPDMAALTLGLSINAIHYFADGNGRTARMVYMLLSKGYNGSEQAQEHYTSVLEEGRGRKVISLNPTLSGVDSKIRAELLEFAQNKYGYRDFFSDALPTEISGGYSSMSIYDESPDTVAVSADVELPHKVMLHRIMEKGAGMSLVALVSAFAPERIEGFVRTSPDGIGSFIDGDEFLPTLEPDEIVHWWRTSEVAIVAYVKRLINVADREDAALVAAYYSGSRL